MAGTFNFSPGAKISCRLVQKWPRYKKKTQKWTLKTFFLKNPPGFWTFEKSSWIHTPNWLFWPEPIYWNINFVSRYLLARCVVYQPLFVGSARQASASRRSHQESQAPARSALPSRASSRSPWTPKRTSRSPPLSAKCALLTPVSSSLRGSPWSRRSWWWGASQIVDFVLRTRASWRRRRRRRLVLIVNIFIHVPSTEDLSIIDSTQLSSQMILNSN